MILLWFVVILLMILVLLLYRQFGLSYLSGRDRLRMYGMDLGTRAQPIVLTGPDGREHKIEWQEPSAQSAATVVLFALPGCPVCAPLAGEVVDLPRRWPTSRFIWVDGMDSARLARAVDTAPGWVVGSAENNAVHDAWDVSGAPFAYVVGRSARIDAKGVVNSATDVEQLLAQVLQAQDDASRSDESRPEQSFESSVQ
jgi:hypothetical protein